MSAIRRLMLFITDSDKRERFDIDSFLAACRLKTTDALIRSLLVSLSPGDKGNVDIHPGDRSSCETLFWSLSHDGLCTVSVSLLSFPTTIRIRLGKEALRRLLLGQIDGMVWDPDGDTEDVDWGDVFKGNHENTFIEGGDNCLVILPFRVNDKLSFPRKWRDKWFVSRSESCPIELDFTAP